MHEYASCVKEGGGGRGRQQLLAVILCKNSVQ